MPRGGDRARFAFCIFSNCPDTKTRTGRGAGKRTRKIKKKTNNNKIIPWLRNSSCDTQHGSRREHDIDQRARRIAPPFRMQAGWFCSEVRTTSFFRRHFSLSLSLSELCILLYHVAFTGFTVFNGSPFKTFFFFFRKFLWS